MAALARCTFYPVCHVVDDWCGLLRALFVAAADLVARLAFEPIEVSVGLVTAAVGGPVFLWLLTRRQDA